MAYLDTITSPVMEARIYFETNRTNFPQMPNLPSPCTNCLRFHFGSCYDTPKQCFNCGGLNHMARFCPQKLISHICWNRCEPMPGTYAWCEKHQLNKDPELRQKIMNALKVSPRSSLWLNGVQIYEGDEGHFFSDRISRDDEYAIQTPRGRSRPPVGNKCQQRSYSCSSLRRKRAKSRERDSFQLKPPESGRLTETDLFGYKISPPIKSAISSHQLKRYRSRSPLRRHSTGPNGSSEATSLLKIAAHDPVDTSRKNTLRESDIQQPQSTPASRRVVGMQLFSYHTAEPRTVLGNSTNKSSTRREEDRCGKMVKTPTSKDMNSSKFKKTFVEVPSVEFLNLDDPYFVLGVLEGASEQEVFREYMERMRELDKDKVEYENNKQEDAPDMTDAFDKSIKLLNAARKKIIGF